MEIALLCAGKETPLLLTLPMASTFLLTCTIQNPDLQLSISSESLDYHSCAFSSLRTPNMFFLPLLSAQREPGSQRIHRVGVHREKPLYLHLPLPYISLALKYLEQGSRAIPSSKWALSLFVKRWLVVDSPKQSMFHSRKEFCVEDM